MADLQTLINAIQTAQDGVPITVDYHNNMLLAVKQMAAQMGVAVTTRPLVITLAAQLTPNDGPAPGGFPIPAIPVTPWVHESGIAKKPGGATSANGWQQLFVPDGMVIQSLVVSGAKVITGTGLGSWTVQLARHPLFGSVGVSTIKSAAIDGAPADSNNNFQVDLGAVAEIIDNSKFKYLLFVKIVAADGAATAEIHSFQITCVQPSRTGGGSTTLL